VARYPAELGEKVDVHGDLNVTAAATARGRHLDAWEQIKAKLAQTISPQEFNNWVLRTSLDGLEDGSLRVAVPDQVTKDFIEQEYAEHIRSTILLLKLPVRSVVYVPRSGAAAAAMAAAPGASGSHHYGSQQAGSQQFDPVFTPAGSQLNSKFQFENFVVGSCNQFAHAAARAVASNPSRSYNPLFIYSGVGQGKTHLMHAIGRELKDQFPSMRIVYTSCERFMNEMILCLRSNAMPTFQRHYRSADVLLVDDVQILANKERMQEEFFHTFNELHDHQKQIVLSSDTTPKNTPGLVERLRSRFEWGLMVDIQPPDLETKMAILDKKAELEGVQLPEDVRIYIATKTRSNVRELEGALVKLMAYSSVTESPISLQMAHQVLKHLVPGGGEKRVTMESVLKAVADYFSVHPSQLKQKSNARNIAYPRQIAMYLIRDMTGSSLPEIGRMFGGKHHTTVLHSVQKIERLRQTDAELNRLIHKVVDSIH
jgi:chromosomal replication initiator protein